MEGRINQDHDFLVPNGQPEPLDGDSNVVFRGQVEVKGEIFPYDAVRSRQSAVNGIHLALVSPTNNPDAHIKLGEETVRFANIAAKEIAVFDLFTKGVERKPTARYAGNIGDAATVTEGFHAHIMLPDETDVLPRLVANVAKVIDELEATDEIKVELRTKLLQKKNPTV